MTKRRRRFLRRGDLRLAAAALATVALAVLLNQPSKSTPPNWTDARVLRRNLPQNISPPLQDATAVRDQPDDRLAAMSRTPDTPGWSDGWTPSCLQVRPWLATKR